MTRDASERRRAYRAGHWAEWIAAAHLSLRGYRIIAMRYAAHGGEIDLIARRGQTIAFIEVKSRATRDLAQDAIGAAKERRFGRAVEAWLMRNGWACNHVLRADAVFIARGRWPQHLENAFEIRSD